jgi:hypothetical protein
MIQNVREQINQPVAKTNTPTQTHPTYQPANSYTISTPPIIPDMRQDIYAKEFEQRQQEYVNLNKKVAPANVNFTEKADDGVIQNMDELVKQQMQQRAYEMSLIPPPISKINQPTTLPSPVNTAPPKLQIDAASNIEISIEELGSTSSKKSVTWKTDDPDMTRLDTEILVLRESINNMSKEFLQLKELFELAQTNIAQLKEANAELATKLNKSIEWSHISIVHLNEATTGLAMKYNELLTKQVEIPQIQSLLQPVLPIPSPDDIKSTMERILTQLDNE